jgi:hypothetical protein
MGKMVGMKDAKGESMKNKQFGSRRVVTVTTYQHAYIGGTSTLCADCAASPDEHTPALGPVQHGAHRGECQQCARRARLVRGVRVSRVDRL